MILDINPYIFVAIGVVLVLVALFVITFLLNKKTPVPKGCEHLKISDENCSGCTTTECSIKQGIDLKKIEEELQSDDKETK